MQGRNHMAARNKRREDTVWRDQLAEIVGALPAGVLVQNFDGVIAYANAEAARIFGQSSVELIGKRQNNPCWQETTVDGRPLVDQEWIGSRVMRTGRPIYNEEVGIERPDGTRVIVSVNGAPFKDSSGNINAVITSFSDVTERKEAEREQERLREFLSSASLQLY